MLLRRGTIYMMTGDNLYDIVFKLIGIARTQGWLPKLVAAARESNPGNARLLAFAQQFGLAPDVPSHIEFEKIIKKTSNFLDVNLWRKRLGHIEVQVCRVVSRLHPTWVQFGGLSFCSVQVCS